MLPEALAILLTFALNDKQAGDLIPFVDFGDALPLEDGDIADEAVREALASLLHEDFVSMATRGLVLTDKGAAYLRGL